MKKQRSRQNPIGAPPVERVVLKEEKPWKTVAIIAALLAVGLFFLGRGVNMALTRQGGWTEIKTRTGSPGCAGEFQFQYDLDDRNGNAEYRALTLLYTDACERASKVYSSTEQDPELGNLCALNAAPNQTVRLEPELYSALELIRANESRTIFLAPLYEYYGCLFFCERDEETFVYDPLRNPDTARTFGEIAAFANDPAQIDIELLGENLARLSISEDYLRYAEENGIDRFVDFGWMKNAFILDDLAGAVRAQGFLNGYLQSADGYGCNLGTKESFSMNVFDRAAGGDGVVAQMTYGRPLSFLSLHSYTNSLSRNDLYYEFADGQTRSIFVDPGDGMPKTALDDLLLWSDGRGCGDLVLQAERAFVRDRFDASLLEQPDLFYAYCAAQTLFCSDPLVRFPSLAAEYRLEQP